MRLSDLPFAATTHAFGIGGIIDTTGGLVRGQPSSLRPDVSEYLGIDCLCMLFSTPIEAIRLESRAREWSSFKTITRQIHIDCPGNRVSMDHAFIVGRLGAKILLAFAKKDNTLAEDCFSVNV